jgi:hypothetical protein
VSYTTNVGKRSVDMDKYINVPDELYLHRTKRQIQNVYNIYAIAYMFISIDDVNNNIPSFTYPVYPSTVSNPAYVFALPRLAEVRIRYLNIF